MNSLAARTAVPLGVALAVGFTLRIYFALATPIASDATPGRLSSYNDEIAHGNYALGVLQTGHLPQNVESIENEGALARGSYENYQPPLYYLTIAGLTKLIGRDTLREVIFVGRFLNIALFIGVLAVFVLIAREMSLSGDMSALGVMFLALNGVMVRFTSTATNDVLFWLFAGIMLWTAVRFWHSGIQVASAAVFFAASVAALYTKLTAVLLLPLLALIVLKERSTRSVLLVFAAYISIFVMTLPIWFRNLHEFGSLLPLTAGFGVPHHSIPGIGFVTYAARSFCFPWQEFWQGWIGLLVLFPFFLCLVSSLLDKSVTSTLVQAPVIFLAFLFTLSAFLWLNFRYNQAEARYLFAVWPALALFFTGQSQHGRMAWIFLAALLLPYSLFLLPALGI